MRNSCQNCSQKVMYIGENKPRQLAAMFFYESGQKCQFSKTITQQLFLWNYFEIGQTVDFILIY